MKYIIAIVALGLVCVLWFLIQRWRNRCDYCVGQRRAGSTCCKMGDSGDGFEDDPERPSRPSRE